MRRIANPFVGKPMGIVPSAFRMEPYVGMIVCDCRYLHLKVVRIDEEDPDFLYLEDGSTASFFHCCDVVPHGWEHPDGA